MTSSPKRRKLSPLGLYRVAGESMAPAYRPGQLLLGYRWARPRPGLVVVVYHEGRPLIKRLKRLDTTTAWIEGDNAAHSTDSRHFGAIPRAHIEAVIVAVLSG